MHSLLDRYPALQKNYQGDSNLNSRIQQFNRRVHWGAEMIGDSILVNRDVVPKIQGCVADGESINPTYALTMCCILNSGKVLSERQ